MKKLQTVIIAFIISLSIFAFAGMQVKALTTAIWTDKADYHPGETVTIYGKGFMPNAYVTLNVTKQSDDIGTSWILLSDANGNFTTTYQIDNTGAPQYIVTATDGTNAATATFRDTYFLSSISVGTQVPDPVAQGSSAIYNVTVKFSGNNQANPGTLSLVGGLPVGASGNFSPNTVPGNSAMETSTLTVTTTLGTTPTGTYTFIVKVVGEGPGGGSLNNTGLLVVAGPSVSVSPTSATMDVGQSETFTAMASGGSGSYSSYKWYVDSTIQSGTTTSSFTYSPGSAEGTHSITATVTDSTGATSALSYPSSVTVNSAPSISTQPSSATMNSGQSVTLSSTVTGGAGSFSWQWYNISGQISGKSGTGSNASYLVSAADTGIYVIFTDTGTGSATPTATATSNPPVAVTVNGVPSLSIAPIGPVTLAVGQPQTFTAIPTGGSGSYSSYHWYKGGAVVPDETGSSYTFDPSSTDSASVYATVTDSFGVTSFASNTVSVSVNQLAITVTPPTDGSVVSGNGTSINYGDGVTFSVTPNTGYYIASITVDGGSVTIASPTGQMVNFINVQDNHTITASFAIGTFTLTVSQGVNGQIAPGTTVVNYGGSQIFSITPATGYHIVDVLVNGVSQGAVSSYTFGGVTADGSITASFAIGTFTLTVSQGVNGQIAPGTTVVNYGGSQIFGITANAGYYIVDVMVNGSSVGAVTSFTFTNVQAAYGISATFAPTSSPTPTPSPTSSPTPTPSPTTVSATIDSGVKVDLAISGNVTAQQMLNVTITSYHTTTTTVSFTITGPSGTVGFGNMTIPKIAIPYGTNPFVYIDGRLAPDQGYTQNDNNYYVWYTTQFSTHQVTIQFAVPPTPQVVPSGLVLAVGIPVTAIILVLAVLAIKLPRRKNDTPELEIKYSTSKSIETKISNNIDANKEPKAIKSTPPINELKESKSPPETNQKLTPTQKANNLKQNRSAAECNHHFGYLRNLPKGLETPDECYFCAKLIECYGKTCALS
jgi:hypothetical protein